MHSFHPDQLEGAPGRLLWRFDQPERHRLVLYVVSPIPPDFAGLVEQAGWPGSGWETKSYTPLLERLDVGQLWNFQIQVNPTRSVGQGGGRGKVIPINGYRKQEVWFREKAIAAGFEIPESVEGSGDYAMSWLGGDFSKFHKGQGSERRTVSQTTARFSGTLRVTDPELLRRALVDGIGRGKAYGSGLLTLAPVT